jgi:hypothetical protein
MTWSMSELKKNQHQILIADQAIGCYAYLVTIQKHKMYADMILYVCLLFKSRQKSEHDPVLCLTS